jgi:two-component system sensor histidine kinase KdpD
MRAVLDGGHTNPKPTTSPRTFSQTRPFRSVRDHGLGITPVERDGMFERFFRGRGQSHRSGTGLGRAICREIVTLHGGRIDTEFAEDGGSRIVVRIPIDEQDGVGADH